MIVEFDFNEYTIEDINGKTIYALINNHWVDCETGEEITIH